ncbi:MAG: site-2 protease family protein [Clostridia bacterium]|nr:site-2 protease family protein [Clostridia bacterium]MBQ7897781.1 site-2 protease family protein [Clostridia bacterium]
MKIVAEPSFLITLAVFFIGGDWLYTLLMLTSALIHEAGHLTVMSVLRVRVRALVLGLFGGTIFLEKKLISYRREVLISVSGSVFNLLASLIIFFILRQRFTPLLFFFFLSNALYGIFNLLPISALDGGQALTALLLMKKEPYEAERLIGLISRITLFLLAIAGLYLVKLSSFNISLFVLLLLLYAESTGRHIISGYEFCRKTS